MARRSKQPQDWVAWSLTVIASAIVAVGFALDGGVGAVARVVGSIVLMAAIIVWLTIVGRSEASSLGRPRQTRHYGEGWWRQAATVPLLIAPIAAVTLGLAVGVGATAAFIFASAGFALVGVWLARRVVRGGRSGEVSSREDS